MERNPELKKISGLKRGSPGEVRFARASDVKTYEGVHEMNSNAIAVDGNVQDGAVQVFQFKLPASGAGMKAERTAGIDLDIENNRELLELLFAEEAPSIDALIALRNELWDAGLSPSMSVFANLAEWAVHVEIRLRAEWNAYEALAEHLGAEILGGPSQPDLLIDGLIPVEVKTGAFGAAALKQLQRYMVRYKTESGVAVGCDLGVPLPDSIRFLKIAFSDKSRRYEVVVEGKEVAK